jgi:hypothetical protein
MLQRAVAEANEILLVRQMSAASEGVGIGRGDVRARCFTVSRERRVARVAVCMTDMSAGRQTATTLPERVFDRRLYQTD